MGLFKVLGGVALGVGSLRSLKKTVNASFSEGEFAVNEVVITGIARPVVPSRRESERDKIRQEGFEQGVKKGNVETIKKCNGILEKVKRGNNFLVASAAVGFCAAASDGDFSEEEQFEIGNFIGCIDKNPHIPIEIKNIIGKLYKKAKLNELKFDEIKQYLDPLNNEELVTLEVFTNDVINTDSLETPEEYDFKNRLKSYIHAR